MWPAIYMLCLHTPYLQMMSQEQIILDPASFQCPPGLTFDVSRSIPAQAGNCDVDVFQVAEEKRQREGAKAGHALSAANCMTSCWSRLEINHDRKIDRKSPQHEDMLRIQRPKTKDHHVAEFSLHVNISVFPGFESVRGRHRPCKGREMRPRTGPVRG